jgi:ATP-dependent DNA helicase RecG
MTIGDLLTTFMLTLLHRTRSKIRDNYLKPLEQVQWILRTNPGTPFAPDQKYRLTEKGKAFLGGMN